MEIDMFKPLGVIALLFALTGSGPCGAAPVLTVQPVGSSSIAVGGTAAFELLLLNPDAVIGAFSVDIAFNPTVLHFLPTASLGTRLGDPTLFEAMGAAGESSSGVLHIDEVSLLDSASLEGLQGGGALLPSLLLASFSFEGLAPGLSSMDLLAGSVQFSDAAGVSLAIPALESTAAVQVIPEPASAALVLLALAAGGIALRRPSLSRRESV
jgi:hypothetical protein